MSPNLGSADVDGLLGLDALESAVDEHPKLGPTVVHRARLEAQPRRSGTLEKELPEALLQILRERGVENLWSHQAEALDLARRGEDVLVTTPTASGKSLVFQLPVLEEALKGGEGRALWLFPLKALAQDQRAKLMEMASAVGVEENFCAIYDGDTPRSLRPKIRADPPRVLITNPDMLHLGLLAHWNSWRPFFASLRWLVLDELHTYRGVFGSHFHHVLARLQRLCARLGARPAVIASSATADNAESFAATLIRRQLTTIETSGAPREARRFVLLRPSASPYTAALDLLCLCLEHGMKTIVFTKARRITELLYSWLRRRDPALAARVRSYRAGFLPQERRRIEGRLASGELDGVISTSALEMGIDIGGLDACILVGYPGSVMATWQRSGRVGRSGRESLTVMVALPDALDQYFLDHPQELLERPCERLIINPRNRPVAEAHLRCAAAELTLSRELDEDYLADQEEAVEALVAAGDLLEDASGSELFCVRRRPHRDVALRGSGGTLEVRLDGGEGAVVGTLDAGRALREAHPGAIYLHGGRSFRIEALDLDSQRALAVAEEADYFTTPMAHKETEILEVLERRDDGPLTAWLARLQVREQVTGYERKRLLDQEVLTRRDLVMPKTEMETVGLLFAAGPAIEDALRRAEQGFMGALHASEHAAISLMPAFALCDRGDIGGISIPFHPQVGAGAVFIYDGHHGGMGLAQEAFQRLPELLLRVRELLDACPCEIGCPSCIQSPKCGNGNRPLDKAGAAHLLRLLLAEEALPEPSDPRLEITFAAPEDESKKGEEGASAPAWGGILREPGAKVDSAPVEEPAAVAQRTLPVGELSHREGSRCGSEGGPAAVGASTSPEVPKAKAGSSKTGSSKKGTSKAGSSKGGSSKSGPSKAVSSGSASPSPASPSPGPSGSASSGSGDLPLTVLFDLETKRSAQEVGGWNRAHRMGIAIGVVCFLEEGRLEVYPEDRVGELHADLRRASLVIGFNSRRFDYAVLSGYTGEDYSRTLPTLDLLEDLQRRIGRRVSLDSLTAATLGAKKSADGLQSLEWVKQGRLDLVESYCRRDVELLRDLYLFGRREGYVQFTRRKTGGEVERVEVDW
ncbi:MAG: DEAD/DEAH box helicase [Acidobacteriota bacterium]